jgi:hypothetical protein
MPCADSVQTKKTNIQVPFIGMLWVQREEVQRYTDWRTTIVLLMAVGRYPPFISNESNFYFQE